MWSPSTSSNLASSARMPSSLAAIARRDATTVTSVPPAATGQGEGLAEVARADAHQGLRAVVDELTCDNLWTAGLTDLLVSSVGVLAL